MASSAAKAFAHPAVIARIAALEAALAQALAQVAALEARLAAPPKPSDNSSLPPASAFKADRAARRRAAKAAGEPPAKRGPQPGHRGVSRSRVPPAQVDQVVSVLSSV